MGAPTSPIPDEIYMQYLEHNHIYEILIDHKIIAYIRYVDDIIIIYNNNKKDIHKTGEEFNKIQSSLRFTMELKTK
jgi:hypothetical protein